MVHWSTVVDRSAPPTSGRLLTLPLVLLAAVGFTIGTTEFLAVGVLPEIATDLDVSVGTAGLAVSLYAAAVAVTTLPMTVWLAHRPPRGLLTGALLTFALAHVLIAVAPSFGVLIAGRVLAATVHGIALGVAIAAAAAIVPPERRGAAVSLVFGGLMVALFLGAPVGTALSGLFGWRVAFLLVGAVALVLGVALARVLPALGGASERGLASLHVLRRAAVAGPLLVIFGVLAGANVLFAYLQPYLRDVSGLPERLAFAGLLAYGLAGFAGNLLGGRLADRAPDLGLLIGPWVVVLALVLLGLGGGALEVALVLLVVWGLAQLATLPIATARAVAAGGTVAATVNNASANAGIALGGFIGGALIGPLGPGVLPWASAAVVAVTAVGVLLARGSTRRPRADARAEDVGPVGA